MRIHTTYDLVKRRREAVFVCRRCGKRRKRVLSASQTINPYNLNAAGELKTVSEITAELDDKLRRDEETMHANFKCKLC